MCRPVDHETNKVSDSVLKHTIMFTLVLEIASTLDMQTLSQDLQDSLQKLREENDYILIASKVPQQYRGSNNLSFLKSIPWFCVFDLFDQKSQTDGFFYILNETNDSARVTVINLGDFNEPTTDLSKRVTTWILRDQMMHENDWTRNSKHCLYKALSTCYEETLARKHWVFLCLSDECLAEMADVIDLLFTILGNDANKYITIISEKKEIGERMIRLLKNSIRKDLQYPRSFYGIPLDLLKTNVQQMLGPNNFKDSRATTDLPYVTGLTPVLNKRINSLTDLEIYCPKPSLTSSVKDIKKTRDDFYKGDTIQQLNLFHRHDIERTLQAKLTRQIHSSIKKLSNPHEQDYIGFVETVNVSYEPGSGATTLCRRILWDNREKVRCAVVKTIETDTDRQISELHRFSYETGSPYIPPVLILVDKFPEQNVFRLIDKLSERKTKCVLLNTIPITQVALGNESDNVQLGKLDDLEIESVKKILGDVGVKDDEKKRAAEERVKRERKFMWLGLELFGREYSKIEDRLSKHIEKIISCSITSRLKDAYQIILHFCCFLDYYSNGQFIYPHACVLEILTENFGLDEECTDKIVYIHDKFGGLLLEDHSEAGCYRGWRPAHFLVGEIIRTKMDLVATVKNFFAKHSSLYINNTQAKKNLIKNVVHACLQRESIYTNSSTSEDDPDPIIEEDDFGEKQKYSKLLLQVMPHRSESEVTNALDILISINENVETDEQKAHSSQQLARVLAYEVGGKTLSMKDASLLSKLSLPCIHRQITDNSEISGFEVPHEEIEITNKSPTSGFVVAHDVIDLAVRRQPNHVHHLVTKGTFFVTELHSKLLETNRPDFASGTLEDFVKEAINIARKGIFLYDTALQKTEHDDGYLYAMIGKIRTIIILLKIFKYLPCFSIGEQRPDESFKLFMTFGRYPEELNSILSKEDLKYFLSLRTTPSQLLDELFEATEERRKQLIKKHRMQKIKNTTRRGAILRKMFYDVTKLDRTPLADSSRVSKEDIVQDILYQHDETSFSGWKKLTSEAINQIYEYTKQAIAKETTNDKVMLIYAKAALKQSNVTLQDLSEHVKNWCKKHPTSRWANLFNYMIKFPVPNGSLNANVPAVNQSIQICKSKTYFPPNEYRKSSAEYFLGKGLGIKAILPSHEFEDSSRKQEMKSANNGRSGDVRDTEFWRSHDVYDKLERLRGQKVLGKRGVLDYKGVEIMFNNEMYPKESRDDLWFCLGFTIYGPYAYDPVDKETFNAIREGFSDEKKVYSDATRTRFCSQKTSEKVSKPAMPILSALPLSSNTMARAPKRSLRPDKEVQSRARNEDEWKTNEKLTFRIRVGDGHQKSVEPQKVDSKGRVMHGAQVTGAFKSIICNRPSERCSAGTCAFAHPMDGDPIRQTVCMLCTMKNKDSCNEKNKHKEHIYDLGPFYNRHGQRWKQRFPEGTFFK